MAVRVYALYPLRLALALLFVLYGVDKFADLEGNARMFDAWGIPLASLAVPLVATAEVLGGLAILAGVLTRASAVALSVVLLVAVATAKAGTGFMVWGLEAVMLGGLLTLLANGPGRPTLASVRDEWRERRGARSEATPAGRPEST